MLKVLRGGRGGDGIFAVARAGHVNERFRNGRRSERAEFGVGALNPLATLVLKKFLGVALGLVLLGFDRWTYPALLPHYATIIPPTCHACTLSGSASNTICTDQGGSCCTGWR